MPTTRRLIPLIATAGALCALGAAAPAQAAPYYEVTYKVELEAVIDYAHTWEGGEPEDRTEGEQSSTIKVTGEIDPVTFRNGRLLNAAPWGTATYESTGGGGMKVHDSFDPILDEWHRTTSACTADSGVESGMAIIDHDPGAPPVAGGGQAMRVRFGESAYAFWNCTGKAGGLEGVELGNHYSQMPLGEGILDGDFELPAESIGMGKIIQHVNAPVAHRSPQYCPGQGAAWTKSCTYGWQGKVTFTKTEEHQYGIEQLPAAPQPKPAPAQSQTPADDDDLIVPLVPEAPKTATLKGNRLTFPVSCPAGCKGAAKIGSTTQRFAVTPSARKVTLKLKGKARRTLRKAKKPVVKLTLTPKDGGTPVRARVRVK